MASLSTGKNGLRRILFMVGKSKKTIYLGHMPLKRAQRFLMVIEDLLSARATSQPIDDATAAWLDALDDEVHAKLAAVELVKPRTHAGSNLQAFLDNYFNAMTVKESTKIFYGHTRRCLIEHFGPDRKLRSLEPSEGEAFRQFLVKQKLSDATVARRIKAAKNMFDKAIAWRLMRENPLQGVKSGSQTNSSRQCFIAADVIERVIDACPDAEWRLLVALSRYGGLRCPSEHLALTWDDVDWEKMSLRVPSSKTEHHKGGGSRVIPIFPELYPYLRQAYEDAPERAIFVISGYRDPASNLRTRFMRIIRKAGFEPWDKLWHNLRSSRQTELAERFPMQVVCKWMGNSQAVALGHYLQVTDDHFERAVRESVIGKTTQNPTQPMPDNARPSETSEDSEGDKCLVFPVPSGAVLPGLGGQLVPQRPVQTSKSPANSQFLAEHDAESNAGKNQAQNDLAFVCQAWPRLSDSARARIAAIVEKELDSK